MINETLRNSLKDEEVINNFYRTNVNYDAEAFRVWAESPMQREAINSAIILYDPELKMLGKFSVGIDRELNISETLDSLKNKRQQIFSHVKSDNGEAELYFGMVPVLKKEMVAGYVVAVAEFNIQNIGSRNFPAFLESNKTLLGSVIDISLLKIFEFKNGKVSQVFGDIYPSREQMFDIFNAKLSKFNEAWISFRIYNEDYIAYVIKVISNEQKRLITVAAKEKEITWNLFNFFKIFLIHSIIIIILFFVMLLTKLLKIQYTFRSRLLLALLLVSIIPIAILAIYNRQVISEKSEKAIFAELSRRSDYLEKHVKAQLEKRSDRDLIPAFKNAGKELDISFVVYKNSSLIYSSRENIYNTGLFSNKLNSQAHYKLNYLSYREYLSKEKIDRFSYDAYYRKVKINRTPLIIGVNDAFNKIKPALSTADIDVILSAFIHSR